MTEFLAYLHSITCAVFESITVKLSVNQLLLYNASFLQVVWIHTFNGWERVTQPRSTEVDSEEFLIFDFESRGVLNRHCFVL